MWKDLSRTFDDFRFLLFDSLSNVFILFGFTYSNRGSKVYGGRTDQGVKLIEALWFRAEMLKGKEFN